MTRAQLIKIAIEAADDRVDPQNGPATLQIPDNFRRQLGPKIAM